jgi:2-oxo-4-hydroxy-4-carboxy-5-ureidoimidazoline decarboxylase
VMGTERLTWFNELPTQAARRELLACCAAVRWADEMMTARPYDHAQDAIQQSDAVIANLAVADLGEALAGHPRIGARVSGQSAAEQSGVDDGSRAALVDANAAYEARFGHVFLICASGLSGSQMLAALEERLTNDPSSERAVATVELEKITVLRVRKAFG